MHACVSKSIKTYKAPLKPPHLHACISKLIKTYKAPRKPPPHSEALPTKQEKVDFLVAYQAEILHETFERRLVEKGSQFQRKGMTLRFAVSPVVLSTVRICYTHV